MSELFDKMKDQFDEATELELTDEQKKEVIEKLQKHLRDSFHLLPILKAGAKATKRPIAELDRDAPQFAMAKGMLETLDGDTTEFDSLSDLVSADAVFGTVYNYLAGSDKEDAMHLLMAVKSESISYHSFVPNMDEEKAFSILQHLVERGLEAHPKINVVASNQTNQLPEGISVLGIGEGVRVALLRNGGYRVQLKPISDVAAVHGVPTGDDVPELSVSAEEFHEAAGGDNCDCIGCKMKELAEGITKGTVH